MRKKIVPVLMVLMVILAASALAFLQGSAQGSMRDKAVAVTQLAHKVIGPKVTYVTGDFKLPPVENTLPVYDKYTLKQRRELKLPLNYNKTRAYDYGDHVAYLTFDDGPDKDNTPKILDVLKKQHIQGTFFLVGSSVEKAPDVVKRIYQEGHSIGNHSYTHEYKSLYANPQAYTAELEKTDEAIHAILGVRPIISRAPGGTAGHFTKDFWNRIGYLGYIEVGWNCLTGDADGTAHKAVNQVENVRKQLVLRPYLNTHLVVLLHDGPGHGETVKALPQIIKLLKDNGYTFRCVTTAIPPSW